MSENESMPKEEKQKNTIDEADLTPYLVRSIFENKIINALNNTLPEKQKVHEDERAKLEWDLDEQTNEAVFLIVKRVLHTRRAEDKLMVQKKINPKTGKAYPDYQLAPNEAITTYTLETEDVQKTFKALDQDVQKVFLQGLEESKTTGERLVLKWQEALTRDLNEDERIELEEKIKEEQKGIKTLEKVIKTLE